MNRADLLHDFIIKGGNKTEEWRPILGFENYSVSNLGNVKRMKTYRNANKKKDGLMNRIKCGEGSRYRGVILCLNNKKHHKYIHRLVVAEFIRHLLPKEEVNHIDGDPANNNISNLEIVDRQGNADHARKTGLVAYGTRCPVAKLNPEKVREIRFLYWDAGKTLLEIGNKFGITFQTVSSVVNGKTWVRVV